VIAGDQGSKSASFDMLEFVRTELQLDR